MKVTRVESENSSWVEPPLDQNWNNLKKLQWCAAVAEHDLGLPEGSIEIYEYPSNFNIVLRGPGGVKSIASDGFYPTWRLLSGIQIGLEMSRSLSS